MPEEISGVSKGFIKSLEDVAMSRAAQKDEPDIGMLRGRLYSRNSKVYRVLSKMASFLGLRESKEVRSRKILNKVRIIKENEDKLSLKPESKALIEKILNLQQRNENTFVEKLNQKLAKGLPNSHVDDELSQLIRFFPKNKRAEAYMAIQNQLAAYLKNIDDPTAEITSIIGLMKNINPDVSALGVLLQLLADHPKAIGVIEYFVKQASYGPVFLSDFSCMRPGDTPIENYRQLTLALHAILPKLEALKKTAAGSGNPRIALKIKDKFYIDAQDYATKSFHSSNAFIKAVRDTLGGWENGYQYLGPDGVIRNKERYWVFQRSSGGSMFSISMKLQDRL